MDFTRRDSIKFLSGSAAGLWALAMLGGCESLLDKIKKRPIRRSITTLSNTDPIVEAYREGVAEMKSLPNSDRRNWTRQATIHDDFCPHGNWYFLPWHRAYLYYFETIIRELSGYDQFALPYWNWTCSPSIPAHFFGAGNTLLDTTRTKSATDVIPTSFTGEDVLEDILDILDFESFGSYESTALRGGMGGGYGELEGTPHNLVHGWIGGNMGGFMSPLDPVFWCHHNMIERCWWDWNITQGKPNPNSNNWTSLSLGGMFCDKSGNLVNNITVGTTALMPLLSYQFDDQLLPCSRYISGFKATPLPAKDLQEYLKRGGPFRLKTIDRVRADSFATAVVKGRSYNQITLPESASTLLARKVKTDQRLVLQVQGAQLKGVADAFVRIFINTTDNTNLRTVNNQHYAGSFAFFGSGHHAMMDHGNTYHIDITNTVEQLLQQNKIRERDKINLTLVAVSMADGKSVPKGEIELSGIEITLSEGLKDSQ